jgi:hypothetical protein
MIRKASGAFAVPTLAISTVAVCVLAPTPAGSASRRARATAVARSVIRVMVRSQYGRKTGSVFVAKQGVPAPKRGIFKPAVTFLIGMTLKTKTPSRT